MRMPILQGFSPKSITLPATNRQKKHPRTTNSNNTSVRLEARPPNPVVQIQD